MYESFFGLRERPFDLVPNPRFLYLSRLGREAVANLRHGLTSPGGLTLLLGDAGTGKTTLVSQVLSELDPTRIECVLLSNPTLTRAEFYEALSRGFSLNERSERSKTRFLDDFRTHLEARQAAGLLTALVVDEAQSLSNAMLEEIRLLSNIDTPTSKLLNVVLAGQPELADRLNDPRLRHLKQRIALRCELMPLSFAETAAYIAGRLRIAGGQPASIFSREAVMAVHETSRGIPRTINVVCHNALISGFATQTKPIVRSIIDEVRRDFDLTREPAGPPVAAYPGEPDEDAGRDAPPPEDAAGGSKRRSRGKIRRNGAADAAPPSVSAESDGDPSAPPRTLSPSEPLAAEVEQVRKERFRFF